MLYTNNYSFSESSIIWENFFFLVEKLSHFLILNTLMTFCPWRKHLTIVKHRSRCLNGQQPVGKIHIMRLTIQLIFAATVAAKSLQSCPTLCDPIDSSPPRLPCPWDSPGKNTGVGCHFLLQCMKVKSESEVVQSCPILRDLMDCSPPGSSFHGIF